jgi:dipeptidyl aminopeptidase/acylaminoacyl peptidase
MNSHPANPLLSFTPDLAEFAVEWLPKRAAAGCTLRPFRLTSARFPDGDVQTYGLFALPAGHGPFPAILHIHGGGQTASPENIAYFTARGYGAMPPWSPASRPVVPLTMIT